MAVYSVKQKEMASKKFVIHESSVGLSNPKPRGKPAQARLDIHKQKAEPPKCLALRTSMYTVHLHGVSNVDTYTV